jgi:hypothetical protein
VLMVTEAAKHIGADRHERTDARTTYRDGHLSTRPLELLVSLLTYSSWWVNDGLRMPREGPYWHSAPKGMGMSQTLSARPAWSPAGQGRQPGTPPARHTSRKGRAGSTSRQEVDTDLPGSVHPPRLRGHRRCSGIARRTFFQYSRSMNDAVWGDFDEALGELEAWPLRFPDDVPLMTAIRHGVVALNTYDPANEQYQRNLVSLILNTDAPQAPSTSRCAAHRMGCRPEDLPPRVVGHVALGASWAACEQWLPVLRSDVLTHPEVALSVLDDSSVLQMGGAQ